MSGIPYVDWSETAWVEGYNPFNGDSLIKNENPFDFSSRSFTAAISVLVISTPTPGLKMFTSIRPRLNEINDAETNQVKYVLIL